MYETNNKYDSEINLIKSNITKNRLILFAFYILKIWMKDEKITHYCDIIWK